MVSGCGTLQGDRGWGQDAIYPLSWRRIPQAAKNALLDPMTWIPAAGAAVFTIDDWDRKTSDWASSHTPVFGSQETAQDTSRTLLNALSAETWATALATPSGDDPLGWTWAKTKGLALEYGAVRANSAVTDLIKETARRERPDHSGNQS